MSILIKGLIMPSCCDGCTFSDWSNLHQTASCKLHDYDPCFADYSREYKDKRADWCPLIEIPEPHEGHWIPHESPDGGEQYECSRCGVLWEFNDGTPEDNEAYFCPKCGKKLITK